MQERESIMTVRCELKIPSLGITVRHHSASLVMPNCYPCDEIFNPHLTTIKDSYNLSALIAFFLAQSSVRFSSSSFRRKTGRSSNHLFCIF